MKKALLLGAGFSYDIGMPLAKDFTKIFFEELRPEKLKSVFERLKNNEPYGKEHPIDRETIDILYDLYLEYYHQPNANYEEFLKAIQTYTKKHSREEQRSCDYVFGFFHSIITDIFLSHQARVSLLFNSLKSFYKDIQNLIPEDDSLWVFSLNHDLIVEMLCMEYKIPLSFGCNDYIEFPISNKQINEKIKFKSCKIKNLNKKSFSQNVGGINLVKIHGALNEFRQDENLIVVDYNLKAPCGYIRKVNDVYKTMNYFINNQPCKALGEIIVSDFAGEMQFLRYSILTGGKKYSETIKTRKDEYKLNLFDEVLPDIDELFIIGYSFADKHINNRIQKIMYQKENMKIHIVDPFCYETPECLSPFDYDLRVRKSFCQTPEWLYFVKNATWPNEEEFKTLFDFRKNRELYLNKMIDAAIETAKQIIRKK